MTRKYVLGSRRGFSNEVQLFISEDMSRLDQIISAYENKPGAWARRITSKKAQQYLDDIYYSIKDEHEYLGAKWWGLAADKKRFLLNLGERATDHIDLSSFCA